MMIVHRIMRDHGGDIGIDGKAGSGTIVTLRFPRSTVWKKIRCKQMNPNLLIVDDEQHTREGLELALEDKLKFF